MEYLCGTVFDGKEFTDGYVGIEDGIIAETGEGRVPDTPIAKGLIVPGLANAHTHCADGLVKFEGTPSLEELVAPPYGLKHVYLENAPDDEIITSMRSFALGMLRTGTTGFADFREGGIKGVGLLRRSRPVPRAAVLGRPLNASDPDEVDMILDAADGIGISSVSDMRKADMDMIADRVRRKGKILGIHVSERVRDDIGYVMSLSPSFVVHMTESSGRDMRVCADNDVPIVSCPRSNMFFGKVPPVGRMIASGADVALGTDNAMLCFPDMRAESKAFSELLKKDGHAETGTVRSLLVCCRKVLYGGEGLHMRIGMPADIAVFPSSGKGVMRDLTDASEDAVLTVIGRTKYKGGLPAAETKVDLK